MEKLIKIAIEFVGMVTRNTPYFRGKDYFGRKIIQPLAKKIEMTSVVEMKPTGVKMICELEDWIPFKVFYYGQYINENNYEQFMLNICKSCTTVFDVGANIGYYTVKLSKLIEGQVYAFEPMKYQMSMLQKNLGLNNADNVTTIKKIVSNNSDIEKIYFSGMQNTGMSSIVKEGQMFEEVESITLDEFCLENSIESIDLIKIDVEGYELHVLKGLQQNLKSKKVKHLFVEIQGKNLAKAEASTDELCSFLEQFGYRGFSIKNRKKEPYSGENESLVYFKLPN